MNDNLQCQCCKAKAKLDLQLSKNVYCEHCNYLKYDTTKKLILCQLHCPNLYWTTNNHKHESGTNQIRVSYTFQKDECNKCGRKGFDEGIFVGSILYQNTCDFCGKIARYDLTLDDDINCTHCHQTMYSKESCKIKTCSTQCSELCWKVVKYLSKKSDKITKVIYQIENDKCIYCSHLNKSVGTFSGQTIPEF